MKIKLLHSSAGDQQSRLFQFLTTYLVNDTLAVDAGSLGQFATLSEQRKVRHVVLSHSHTDHIGSLPIFLENVAFPPKKVLVHASENVLNAVRQHVFNDQVWPALVHFGGDDNPSFALRPMESGVATVLDGVSITPVLVNHVVPTYGFILQQGEATVVFSMDTGPTVELWKQASTMGNIRAVFLEVAFPNSKTDLANLAKHLTPALFAQETAKIPSAEKFVAVHIKPAFYDEVAAELKALGMPNLEIVEPGREYEFL